MIRKFAVEGSGAETYDVMFQRKGTSLYAYCTCKAGKNGMHCKHRIRIFQGDKTGIVSGNEGEVSEVASWVEGSEVEGALAVISDLEAKVEQMKKELAGAKKALARAMRE